MSSNAEDMKFIPIANGSKGNAYLVEADEMLPLLLEAGIPIQSLREKLKFGLSGLAGCLISHEHGDHSKAVKDMLKAGVDCYMSEGTAKALGMEQHHRVTILKAGTYSVFKGWIIMPFHLEHDAAEPFGFLIAHDTERLLFVPDTGYVKNRFTGITIAAIECNFNNDILSRNILNGHLAPVVGHRIRRSHMSLQTVMEMLKANDLSRLRQVWLLHLSDGNSDERRMIKKIQEVTGVPVYAA